MACFYVSSTPNKSIEGIYSKFPFKASQNCDPNLCFLKILEFFLVCDSISIFVDCGTDSFSIWSSSFSTVSDIWWLGAYPYLQ